MGIAGGSRYIGQDAVVFNEKMMRRERPLSLVQDGSG